MKRLCKKEFVEKIIAGAEKVIAKNNKTPEKAIEDAQKFIDTYNKYPFAYLDNDGSISISCKKI